MPGGKASRAKGDRIEREIVEAHHAVGVRCERVPLSGAAGGSFSGDLRVDGDLVAEVKARGNGSGFLTIERWLAGNDLLFLRADKRKPLVVMPWDLYADLISAAKKGFHS